MRRFLADGTEDSQTGGFEIVTTLDVGQGEFIPYPLSTPDMVAVAISTTDYSNNGRLELAILSAGTPTPPPPPPVTSKRRGFFVAA